MASNIKSFLIKNTRIRVKKTIPATLINGDRVEIDIQSLFGEEIKNIRSKNMRTYPPAEGTGNMTTALDDMDFAVDILIKGITAPDLSNIDIQDNFGATTQSTLIYRMFDLEEIGRIAGIIVQLGGEKNKPTTEGTEPEAIREAKNS